MGVIYSLVDMDLYGFVNVFLASFNNFEFRTGYWIGLTTSDPCDECKLGSSATACENCRKKWTWYDGTPNNWGNWEAKKPDNTAKCGRMLGGRKWRSEACDSKNLYQYICKVKGT